MIAPDRTQILIWWLSAVFAVTALSMVVWSA